MFNFSNIFLALPLFYLDPGSGSFLIQLLLAVILGAGVTIRLYWSRLKSLFTGKKPQASDPVEEQDEE